MSAGPTYHDVPLMTVNLPILKLLTGFRYAKRIDLPRCALPYGLVQNFHLRISNPSTNIDCEMRVSSLVNARLLLQPDNPQ